MPREFGKSLPIQEQKHNEDSAAEPCAHSVNRQPDLTWMFDTETLCQAILNLPVPHHHTEQVLLSKPSVVADLSMSHYSTAPVFTGTRNNHSAECSTSLTNGISRCLPLRTFTLM